MGARTSVKQDQERRVPKVAGSNPTSATMNDEGLADAEAANHFRLLRNWFGRDSCRNDCPAARRNGGYSEPVDNS